MRKHVLPLLLAGLILLGGRSAAQESQTYRPVATVQDIMKSMVDPSADYIWDAVATEISATGVQTHAPKNEREWTELRNRTLVLLEASNLMVMPGRQVAKAGYKPENPDSEMTLEQMESIFNSNRPSFTNFANGLRDTALKTLAAVEAKDLQGVLQAGAEIDAACENCHVRFWYTAKAGNPLLRR